MMNLNKKLPRWVTVSLFGTICAYALACVAFAQYPTKSVSRQPNRNPAYLARMARAKQLSAAGYKAWHEEKNLPKAEAIFRQKIAIDEFNPFSWHSLAQVLDAQGKSAEAYHWYDKVANPPANVSSTKGNDPEVLDSLARLAKLSGHTVEANRADERSRRAKALQVKLQRSAPLGEGYPKVPMIPETQEMAHAYASDNEGITLQARGLNKSALESYEEALRIQPNLAIVQFYYGVGLQESGRNAEAKQAFTKAVQLDGSKNGEVKSAALESIADQ